MADLDDFFAKKDRKKAKGKKFTTTEEVAKKLEETGKRTEKMKSKEKPTNPEGEETQQIEDEDEWKEFEIEEKKDLRGLKIGNLSVKETVDVESDDERGTGDNSSDGETGENTAKSGPWKKPEVPQQQQQEVVEVVTTPATAAPATPTSMHSSYVPPHLRNPTAMTSSAPRSRAKNAAPDIHSEEYFPTLSSKPQSNESTGPWGRRKREEGTFEEVRNRGGSRSYSMQESQAQTPKLSLGNKYGALSQDQS
ncbi:protein CDV3 homolog [Polistes fuscatus]|uniref:protein CDV3 homolog n=1 Tax=Polistes fuscatus TaxID=30207 RepID=UPI001CA99C20|nr:protein CDV3 homolog [Polistes fuscatus]